jgi:hypothetical protein
MQVNKIKEMQVVVEDLLHQYAHYRDSDTRIIAHIWMRQLGGLENMKSISLYDFLQLWIENKNIVSPDTITRARRKVQEENVDLRGKTYKKRKEQSKDVKKNIV